ncbi:MAG TPA: zinc ribbon domain-containing protein [Bryobacteraceae bacterium]|nr:zinc ribbon domain-containing protein [Bryobacteraceae bacterium]
MPEFCTCGAQLPPDARFCHKCGKPQYDYPGLESTEAEPEPQVLAAPVARAQTPLDISFHNRLAVRIGFIAAAAAVVVCLIPIPLAWLRLPISLIAAGFLAVYLYSRRTGQALTLRSGARMGWITGIFLFILFSVLFTIAMVMVTTQGGLEKQLQTQIAPNDPRWEMLRQILNNPAMIVAEMIFILMFFFVILTALPMIGGALGAKVLEKESS